MDHYCLPCPTSVCHFRSGRDCVAELPLAAAGRRRNIALRPGSRWRRADFRARVVRALGANLCVASSITVTAQTVQKKQAASCRSKQAEGATPRWLQSDIAVSACACLSVQLRPANISVHVDSVRRARELWLVGCLVSFRGGLELPLCG